MPLKHFIADNKSIAKAFIDYIEYIYGGNCMIDDQDEEGVHLSMNVPGDLKREDFENDVQDFCEEHNCTFELVNQAPNAPSPQYFSENMKLMYPRVKNYEALAKDPRKLEKAKVLFKQSWNQEFNEEDEDDKEDIVLLWNEYMEELSEWKPVEVKLHYNQDLKQDSDKQESYKGYARKPYTNLSSEEEQIRHELEWDLGAKEDSMGMTLSHAYDDLLRDYKYVRGNENAMNKLMKAFNISKDDLLRYIAYKEDGLLMPKDRHKTRDSEDPERYAIILNGEWYKTVNSYQKAVEEQEKLQSTEDEDFIKEYGEFPSVEIKPIKDEPIFLMNGKLVKVDNHRDIKENKNFPEIRGNKSEVEQKCKEYQDIWNIDRTDGYIWILKPVMVGSENR